MGSVVHFIGMVRVDTLSRLHGSFAALFFPLSCYIDVYLWPHLETLLAVAVLVCYLCVCTHVVSNLYMILVNLVFLK